MYLQNTYNKRTLNKKPILFLLIILAFFIMLISLKSPKLSLNGDAIVNTELNSNYSDAGVTAKYGSKDISNTIETDFGDNFSTNKLGSYTITYIVKKNNKTVTATRTVNVVDSTAPEIKLNGNSEINIAKDSNYQELGCTATDNYDGDITTKISIDKNIDTSKIGTYTVTYTVKDSSNNEAKATRTVNVVGKGSKNISTEKSKGLPVLMYHFFYDKNSPPKKLDANYMEIHDFEEQLKYLTENNYYFPTWEEVKSYVDGTSCLPEHSIVLTADDGDATFFDLAIPIVEKYNVKITSFLITSWVEDQSKLKNYDSNKIIFESHSHDMHRAGTDGKGRILTLSYDEACNDVKTSQSFIGNATVFCYPFGHYNDACYKILKDSGYTLAFTTKYGRVRPGDNCYALSRIRMSKGDSLKSFISKVE